MIAQSIADREGPRVDVSAEVTQLASSRQVRAHFRVEDDSYVLIGQVDGSGTVRIVFPTEPHDDGFVTGRRSYQTPDFFAGFPDEYRYRFNYARYARNTVDQYAYDGALGYLFIVASWRPMHFEKFSSEGRWDSFELADPESMRDPKPAIYELASLLAGENREAYTVKFAKYLNTIDDTPGFGSSNAMYGYGAGLCSGYNTLGWASLGFPSSPFGIAGFEMANGQDFTYRGSRYVYSPVGGCYYQAPLYLGNPFGIAGVPGGIPTTPRVLSATDPHRPPPRPRQPPKLGPLAPGGAHDVNASSQLPKTSPTYRQRGLLTDDENTPRGRREPRAEPLDGGRSRPGIQQMVARHLQDAANSGSSDGSSRAARGQANDAGNRSRVRSGNAGQSSGRDNSGSRTSYEGGRSSPSPRSAPSPRSEPSSSGRTGTTRVSSPPPAPAPAPRSDPSSGSSSGSKVKPPSH
jgi:hypothetical protein